MIRTSFLLIACAGIALMTSGGCAGDEDVDRQAAAMTGGGDPVRGRYVMDRVGCASCHTIPGIRNADALVGPPLTHMAARTYIGGVMKNNPDNMIRWLLDPPGVDPMTAMPNLRLSDTDARDVASYLYTLR